MTDDFRFRWLDMVHKAKLTDSAKVVGSFLFARAGSNRTCFPSLKAIMAGTALSRSTTKRAVRQLVAAGLLHAAEGDGPLCSDGWNHSTLYRLEGGSPADPLTPLRGNEEGVHQRTGGSPVVDRGSASGRKGGSPADPGIDQLTDQEQTIEKVPSAKPKKPPLTPKLKKPKSEIKAQCAAIYDAYPKHSKRGTAIPAIAKALSKTPYIDLLDAVKVYRIAKDGADKTFIPLCASWMHAEQWTDDRAEWLRWRSQPQGDQAMVQPGRPSESDKRYMEDQRAEEKRLTAETQAARLLIAEHDEAAIAVAWQAVLAAIVDKSFRARMEKAGWEQWKISIAKRLDHKRFGELTRDPHAPPPDPTTLF